MKHTLIQPDSHFSYMWFVLMVSFFNCDDPFETVNATTDDYKHTLPPNHRVIKGNYLEIYADDKDGFMYYVEKKKEAIISSLCVIGICPPLQTKEVKKKGKLETMFFVDNELHQSLCELAKSDLF